MYLNVTLDVVNKKIKNPEVARTKATESEIKSHNAKSLITSAVSDEMNQKIVNKVCCRSLEIEL